MATLRSFQNEIDEIHNREASKQRVQALHEKENKPKKGKVKEEGTSASESVDTNNPERRGPQDLEEGILVRFAGICLSPSLSAQCSLFYFQRWMLVWTLPAI